LLQKEKKIKKKKSEKKSLLPLPSLLKEKDKVSNIEEESKERKRKDRILEHFAASQCLFCGDIMINSVQEPFIGPDEDIEVGSWRIRQATF